MCGGGIDFRLKVYGNEIFRIFRIFHQWQWPAEQPMIYSRNMTFFIGAAIVYAIFSKINMEILAASSAYGANYIWLPAGVRLLIAMLLGVVGAAGVAVASTCLTLQNGSIVNLPDAIAYGLISGFAPYLAMRSLMGFLNCEFVRIGLTGKLLLQLTLWCAMVNAGLKYIFFLVEDPSRNFLESVLYMVLGDCVGTLIVLYSLKYLIYLFERLYRLKS
jgi:hypothetical protein